MIERLIEGVETHMLVQAKDPDFSLLGYSLMVLAIEVNFPEPFWSPGADSCMRHDLIIAWGRLQHGEHRRTGVIFCKLV